MWRQRAVFRPEKMQLHLYPRCPSHSSLLPKSTQCCGRPRSKSSPHPGHPNHIQQPEIVRWEKRPQHSPDQGNPVLQSMSQKNRWPMTPRERRMEEGRSPGPQMLGAFYQVTRHTSSNAASDYLDTSHPSKLHIDELEGRWKRAAHKLKARPQRRVALDVSYSHPGCVFYYSAAIFHGAILPV